MSAQAGVHLGPTPEELEEWRHFDLACLVAEEVRRYVTSGEPLYDLELVERIQTVLREHVK